MQRLNLLNIDLNLLVALDALVEEENVSRAAARIGVTQPAMSRTLRQLRELFGDELLRRTTLGMKPTPKAMMLAQAIRPNLENIAAAIGQRLKFDPATASRRFVLALPDQAARLALPRVVKQISAQAPGVELAIVTTVNRDALHKLETGQAELAMGVYDHLPRTLRAHNRRALREVCVADPANPLIRNGVLDLETFLALPHVAVTMAENEGTPLDTTLETLGLRRRIVITTPYYSCVPSLVCGTQNLAVVVEDLLDVLPERKSLARFPIPITVEPVMSKMVWHARSDEDLGHTWLRNLFINSTPVSDQARDL
ncbi:MAG TPA: LysR family transcriptional regulator [Ensifer sp.]|nr:LysR family transcriptional regulator [Ensifer sp.]